MLPSVQLGGTDARTHTPATVHPKFPQLRAVPSEWTPPPPEDRDKNRTRRPNRAWETEEKTVLRAVPTGSVRAAHGRQVLHALDHNPDYARMNRQRRKSLRAVLSALLVHADYEAMTSRPTWPVLGEAAGCSRSSIHRHLTTLMAMGLVGTVASGRTAAYAAAGPDGERINEAAVYVLCVPAPLSLLPSPGHAVGEVGTPPAVGGSHLKKKELTTHARKENPQKDAAPRRRSANGGSAAETHLPAPQPVDHWPANRTPASKIQRRAAASQIQVTALPLRVLSPADVASTCRDFFLAGWTVNDVLHAIDHHPDTGAHQLNSIPVGDQSPRVRGWLAWRLGAWRSDDGTPRRSRSQQLRTEATRARALAAAERQRIEAERQAHAERIRRGDSPSKLEALARIRATLRGEDT